MRKIAVTVIAVIAAALTACGGGREQAHPEEHATGTAAAQATTAPMPTAASQAPYDLQFLDTMAKHHQGAVEMAKMAEGKIQHAELRKLVARIPADQQKEIDQMKAWRGQWYANAPPAENMAMPGMAQSHMDMGHMTAMQAGPQYDAMFIDMMVPHHEGAVAMSQEALERAEHAEVKTLAQSIIKAQTGEIAQMKQWKAQLSK